MSDKVIKTSISIDADIKNFEQGIDSISSKLNKLALPTGMANSFMRQIESMKTQIDQLKSYTENNQLSVLDKTRVQKSLETIQTQYKAMISALSSERLDGIVSKEDKNRLDSLSTAIDKYKKEIGSVFQEESKLNKERERAALNLKAVKDQIQQRSELEKKATMQQTALESARARQAQIENAKNNLPKTKTGNIDKRTKEYKEWQQQAENAVKEVQAAEENLAKTQEQLGNSPSLSQLNARFKTASGSVERADIKLKEFQKTAVNPAVERATQKTAEAFKKLGEKAPKTAAELKLLEDKLQREKETTSQTTLELKNFIDELRRCDEAQQNMSAKTSTAIDNMQKMNETAGDVRGFLSRIKQFTGMAGAMMIFRKSAQAAFNAIKELDAQMTEMAVVTNQDIGDYWKQMPEHTKRANDLGLAIKDVYEAETLYYQQGLKTNAVVDMSNSTLRMARIAGLSAAEATDKMTAALRGFNMELNGASADRVADVYSKLAAITASNVDEISTAMTKTASIASNAGMQFETTAAFLSQIIETTRESAETAGTALKTVIARFQELKKDPSEIGEVDGEIIDANKIETALRSVGVELRDVSGQFRDLDTVFMELADKWDSLDTNTQRYIATIAAGSRQQSRFIAMMSDYSRTQELVNAANDAAGASNLQFAKTLDSLETKLNRLKNAWDEFTTGLLNSDIIKLLIEGLTKILSLLNSLTSDGASTVTTLLKLGLIVGVVFAAKSAVDAFKHGMTKAHPIMDGLAGVAKSTFGVIKNEVLSVGKDFNLVFRKKHTIQVRSDALIRAKQASKQLVYVEEQLKKQEHGLITINQKYANGELTLKQAQEARARIITKQNELTGKQNLLEKQITKTGLSRAMVEKLQTEQTAKGLTVQDVAILTAHGYTEAEIENMGAIKAKALAEDLGNKKGLQTIIITKLKTKASEWENKGILRAILSKRLKILVEKLEARSAAGAAKANIALAGSIWACVWPILVVIAALAALIALIMLIIHLVKKSKENSPEGRLKKDQKALEQATEAANNAAEAYKNLTDSVKSLKEGYDNLKNMTRGTDEWREELEKVNEQAQNLIDKYPDLEFKYDSDGILQISEESLKAVQNAEKIKANNLKMNELVAQQKVADTSVEVQQEKARDTLISTLNKQSGATSAGTVVRYVAEGLIGGIYGAAAAITESSIRKANNKNTIDSNMDVTAKYAEALSEGKVGTSTEEIKKFFKENGIEDISDDFVETLKQSKNELYTWGESLKEASDTNIMIARKMASMALQQAELDDDEKAAISNSVTNMAKAVEKNTSDSVNSFKEQYEKGSKDQKKQQLQNFMSDSEKKRAYETWARETYGADVTIDQKTGEIKNSGGEVLGNSSVDTIAAFMSAQSLSITTDLAEKYSAYIQKKVPDLAKKFGNKEAVTGRELAGTYNEKKVQTRLAEIELEQKQQNLTEQKKQELLIEQQYLTDLAQINKIREDNLQAAKNYGLDLGTYGNVIDQMSAEVIAGFMTSMNEANISQEDGAKLWSTFTEALSKQDLESEDMEAIARSLYSLDKTNKFAIEKWKNEMETTYRGLNIDWSNIAKGAVSAGDALYKLSEEEFPTFIDNIQKTIKTLKSGSGSTTISKEEWEKQNGLKELFGDEASKYFVTLNDGSMQFIGSVTQLIDLIEKRRKEVLPDQIKSIQQERQKAIEAAKTGGDEVTDAKLLDYSKRITTAALSEGQSMTDPEITQKIIELQSQTKELAALNKKTALTDKEKARKQELQDSEAILDGYINARIATALQTGVDESLVKKLQTTYKNGGDLTLVLGEINDAIYQLNPNFSDVVKTTQAVANAEESLVVAQNKYNSMVDDSSITTKQLSENLKEQKRIRGEIESNSSSAKDEYETAVTNLIATYSNDYSYKDENGRSIKPFQYNTSTQLYKINPDIEKKLVAEGKDTIANNQLEAINNLQTEVKNNAKKESDARTQAREEEANWQKSVQTGIDKVADIEQKAIQAQITHLTTLNETITNTQSAIVSGMKEQISLQRQIRDNTKTENGIEEKEKRLAYLMADSSGGHTNEIVSLQKEIEEARQEQTDQLIDQQLEQISSDNEKAAEQRQKQIDLLQAQLDYYQQKGMTDQAFDLFRSGALDSETAFLNSDFVNKVKALEEYQKLSPVSQESYLKDLYKTLREAVLGISYLNIMPAHANGGLVDYTGPSWLDGSPNAPELVLDANDTKNFLILRDILSEVLQGIPRESEERSNNTYVDVNINVDSLTSDYDVNEVARQIQDYIAEEALYRNSTMVTNRR